MENLKDKAKDCIDEIMLFLFNELNYIQVMIESDQYTNEYIIDYIEKLKDAVD